MVLVAWTLNKLTGETTPDAMHSSDMNFRTNLKHAFQNTHKNTHNAYESGT